MGPGPEPVKQCGAQCPLIMHVALSSLTVTNSEIPKSYQTIQHLGCVLQYCDGGRRYGNTGVKFHVHFTFACLIFACWNILRVQAERRKLEGNIYRETGEIPDSQYNNLYY